MSKVLALKALWSHERFTSLERVWPVRCSARGILAPLEFFKGTDRELANNMDKPITPCARGQNLPSLLVFGTWLAPNVSRVSPMIEAFWSRCVQAFFSSKKIGCCRVAKSIFRIGSRAAQSHRVNRQSHRISLCPLVRKACAPKDRRLHFA